MNLQPRPGPAAQRWDVRASLAESQRRYGHLESRKAVVQDARPVAPTTRTATLPRTSSDHLRGHLHAYKPSRVATYEAAIEYQRKAAASGQSMTFTEALFASTRKA